MKTQKEAINWLNNSIGKQYDFDGYYGFQCFDYSAAYFYYVTGFRLAGEGAKDIPFANNLNGIATVFKNSINFVAQPGDVVVWGSNFGKGWGHTGVVIAADYYSITVIEQNWLNGGWTDNIERGGRGWEVATKRVHSYETQMWFVRPKYAKNKVTSTISNTINKTTKPAIKPNVTTWQVNKYGTRWKKESATFTALHDIRTRYTGPFRNMKQAGVLKKGQSVKYDEVMVQDGHVWISWTASDGNRVYMPIRTHNANKDGVLWGTIK